MGDRKNACTRRKSGVIPASIFALQLKKHSELCTRRQYEEVANPEVVRWLELNDERSAAMSEEELDELFSLAGTGGPLTPAGVEQFVASIEKKRELKAMVSVIAETELGGVLEKLLRALYQEIQPYRDNGGTANGPR